MEQEISQERLERFELAKKMRPWRYYAPVAKLRDGFHSSSAPLRLVVGPNRGSKSTAGAFEIISYATGYNHIRNEHYETPNICWASTLDHINLGPVQLERVMEMAPHGSHFNNKDKVLLLPPPWGSKIYFKVCEAGWEKYQGQGCMAIWQDEEWPDEEGLKIFKECMRRTKPGWPLKIFMTLTPLSGYTWTYDHLWNPESKKRFKNVETFNFTLQDCAISKGGFLTDAEIENMDQNLDPFERKARILGEYAPLTGSPAFDPKLVMEAMERALPSENYNIRGVTLHGVPGAVLDKDPAGDLVIISKPQAGRQYIVGADPSMGVHRDRSVASVWDRAVPVEVAYFASNSVEPALFARNVLAPLASYYNNALVVVENNSQAGGATLSYLSGSYGHIYMQQDYNVRDRSFTRKYGWRTDLHSRGLVFSTFKDTLRMGRFIPSEDMMREAMNMIVDDDNKIDHMPGRNDDHVMAGAIALAVNRLNPSVEWGDLRQYRELYSGDNAWMGS